MDISPQNQKKKKKKTGFTLVEVIVVAVIVAVLATVAIPLYTGYVESSKQNTIENCAANLASFLGGAAPLNYSIQIDATEHTSGTDSVTETQQLRTVHPDTSAIFSEFVVPSGVVVWINVDNGEVGAVQSDKPSVASKTYRYK